MINGLFTFTGVPKLAPILIKKVSDSVSRLENLPYSPNETYSTTEQVVTN